MFLRLNYEAGIYLWLDEQGKGLALHFRIQGNEVHPCDAISFKFEWMLESIDGRYKLTLKPSGNLLVWKKLRAVTRSRFLAG